MLPIHTAVRAPQFGGIGMERGLVEQQIISYKHSVTSEPRQPFLGSTLGRRRKQTRNFEIGVL